MKRLAPLIGLVAILVVPRPSLAQNSDTLFEKAMSLYQAQKFKKALPVFRRAWKRSPKPKTLFHVGLCHKQLGQFKKALAVFERIMARKDRLTDDLKPLIETAIQESRSAIAAKKAPPRPSVNVPVGPLFIDVALETKRVVVPAFQMDKFEVTGHDYSFCVNAGSCKELAFPSKDPQLPVTNVTWTQADSYCRFVGKSLPTEAQWERAARLDSQSRYPWGDNKDCSQTNLSCAGFGSPQKPGSIRGDRSKAGVMDLGGNVSEWTLDWYNEYRQAQMMGPDTGTQRCVKGGSYRLPIHKATTQFRFGALPQGSMPDVGFRCAKRL